MGRCGQCLRYVVCHQTDAREYKAWTHACCLGSSSNHHNQLPLEWPLEYPKRGSMLQTLENVQAAYTNAKLNTNC